MLANTEVEKFMTPTPHTINAELTLSRAEKMMFEHKVRHFPVLEAGQLVGVISDRDLKLAMGFSDVCPDKVTVKEVCTDEVVSVSPKAALKDVAAKMLEGKFGSVLVMDNKKLVGIFTWVDALKALTRA